MYIKCINVHVYYIRCTYSTIHKYHYIYTIYFVQYSINHTCKCTCTVQNGGILQDPNTFNMLPYGKGPWSKDVATTDVMVLNHLCLGDDLRVPF